MAKGRELVKRMLKTVCAGFVIAGIPILICIVLAVLAYALYECMRYPDPALSVFEEKPVR